MKTRALFCVLFLGTPLAAHPGGIAGSGPTVCAAYESTPLIFRARVLEAIPIPLPPPVAVTYPDGTKTTLYSAGTSMGPVDHVRLQVLEVFKGDPGSEITVLGGDSTFGKGGEFLVYAAPNTRNELWAVARTGPLTAPFAAADLAWLRAYPTAPATVSISGSVSMGFGPISIMLTGPTTRTVSTAEDHSYAFKDLPPGAYTVTAFPPAGYTTMRDKNTAAVALAAKGCVEVDFTIRHDTHIGGTVTDTAGKPASNAHVGLLTPAQNRTGYNIVSSRRTGADGRYDFARVDPGDYWIALDYLGPNNNDPHTPVYYPSGPQASAQLIRLGALGPSANRDDIDLVLPPALIPVSIHLHVVNPDGSPVIKSKVSAIDPLTPTQFIGATADENGDATITLYAGRTYSLEADTSGYREPGCAGPVKFIAKEGLQLGTLTLNKTITECRALERSK